MNTKKDFNQFAASVFGDTFGQDGKGLDFHPQPNELSTVSDGQVKQKCRSSNRFEKQKQSQELSSKRKHAQPIDVVAIEKDKTVKDLRSHKDYAHGWSKEKKAFLKSYHDNNGNIRHVSPVLDCIIEDERSRTIKAPKSNKHKAFQTRTDSGISMGTESIESSITEHIDIDLVSISSQKQKKHYLEHGIAYLADDSDSEVDIKYFCVDHMKMCDSKAEQYRHSKCHREVATPPRMSASPCLSRNASSNSPTKQVCLTSNICMPEYRHVDIHKVREARPDSGSPFGETSLASRAMHSIYNEMLVKLNDYSGVMVKDREDLKRDLATRKLQMEAHMQADMDLMIAKILELKDAFLKHFEESHRSNLDRVERWISRLNRIRIESREAINSLQVPMDFDNFNEYKRIVSRAEAKTDVLKKNLKKYYDASSNYNYDFENSPSVDAIYKLDTLASIEPTVTTPSLPPFLSSTETSDNYGSDVISKQSCLKGSEFLALVSDTECLKKARSFTGCAYVGSDAILLADWMNGELCQINKFGIVADILKFDQCPWDVAYVCADKAAVTVPKLHKVFFVETKPLRIVGKFDTGCDCFGICKVGDKFAVICAPWSKSPSLRMFSNDGHFLSVIWHDDVGHPFFKCPLYVCADMFDTTLYVSDSGANCILGISMSGERLFCYENNQLQYPAGMASDRNNRLYVCSKATGIHVLSNKGVLQEILYPEETGQSSPGALCFHPNGDHAAVTDMSSTYADGFWKMAML
ncbi:hypothetical protein DPMN_163495 [Dreissena polymorpha]|uniref:Uncharacterized protein n=1 Tax=Dreissena polymorpha TaxID=45954 RepID=A0A9D4IUM3_DREPO|nr:hypothetical protein DPMN_163495 [Dreissena polymorpha]